MVKEYTLYKAEENIEAYGDNVCISFFTDAQRFVINYAVDEVKAGNFPHVGITAREGLAVLYRKCKEDTKNNCSEPWMPVDLLSRDYHVSVNMSHMIRKTEKYEVLIYGPILAHLIQLSIEADAENYFQAKVPCGNCKKILFLGGVETYGMGVTSAAMMFSNVIRRHDNVTADRISYNQNDYLNLIHGSLKNIADISVYDAVIIEADSMGQRKEIVNDYLKKVLEQVSPCGHIMIWHSIADTDSEKKCIVKNIVKEWTESHENCAYLNLDFIFTEQYKDMCTYSNKFMNDAGNVMLYRSISKEIARYLWNI